MNRQMRFIEHLFSPQCILLYSRLISLSTICPLSDPACIRSRDLRKQLFGRYKRRSPERDDRGRDDRRNGGRDDRGGGYDRRGGGGHDDRRGRERERDGGRGGRERESSAERRAKIAAWNKEKEEETPAGGGAYAGVYGGGM